MEEQKNVFSELGRSILDVAESWYKLTILRGTKKLTHLAASLLTIVSVVFLGMFVLFFLGIALAIWLGDLLNNSALGYILVALLYLTIMIILVVMRNRIVFPFIRDAIIKKLYEQNKS